MIMAMKMNAQLSKLFGAFILVLIGTALAPEIFSNIAGMGDNASIPSWLVTTLTAVVGAGVLFLIWRAVE